MFCKIHGYFSDIVPILVSFLNIRFQISSPVGTFLLRKMWFMYLVSWVALLFQICLITLAIAAGLFYIAELVEEYTVLTGKVIKYLILFTTVIYIGLFLFEDLDTSLIVVGLLGNAAYFALLQSFPYFILSSPSFIASVVMVVMNHYFAFSFFATVWYPFSDVLAYFTICLWLVPFAFFVSLSANENVLPTMAENRTKSEETTDVVSNYFRKKTKGMGLLSFLKNAQDTLLPQRVRKQY